MDLSWADARREAKGDTSSAPYDDWVEQEAERWAKRFTTAFGSKAAEHPEILARALQMYSAALPGRMMEAHYWEYDLSEGRLGFQNEVQHPSTSVVPVG